MHFIDISGHSDNIDYMNMTGICIMLVFNSKLIGSFFVVFALEH